MSDDLREIHGKRDLSREDVADLCRIIADAQVEINYKESAQEDVDLGYIDYTDELMDLDDEIFYATELLKGLVKC